MHEEYTSVQRRLVRRVRHRMLEREWNVCALSENAGVSPAQTYRVFGGEAVPSLRWIVRIANALETPVGSLMSD